MTLLSYQEFTTSSLVSGPVPSSQAEIDNEIVALAERMRALKTHRNSLSSISSIPPEILDVVFVHLTRQVQSLYPPSSPAVLSWLNVTHVCRHWREVAIVNPHLWVTPFLGSLEVTEEMLMRSKSAPLILRTGSRYRNECVQKVFEHVERLQEVSLDCSNSPTHYILALLDELSSCSAPSLRSFSLDGGRNRMPLVAIPTSFMAPNLRRLQISHCDLSWASPILTGLTVLDINAMSDGSLPTLDGLISALRRMPALHTLSLEGALPTLLPGTKSLPYTSPAMNVQLPHLERLRLVGKMIEVANVLARVELPVSTRLEVQLVCRIISYGDSDEEWNTGLSIISRALESCFNDKSRQFARSMRLSGNGHFRLQYGTVPHPTSWVRSVLESSMEWTSECPVTIDFRFLTEASRAVIKKIWSLVPLGRLEALYFEKCPHPHWDGFWTDVLGHTARNLSYICLRGTSHLLKDLFKSMRSQNLMHSVSRFVEMPSRRRPILSPALSHLILENLEFSTSMVGMQPRDLRDVFIDRVNDGRELDKLTVSGCTGISPRDVQLLREVVADVEWDEYEDSDLDDNEFHNSYDSFDDEDDEDDSQYGYSI